MYLRLKRRVSGIVSVCFINEGGPKTNRMLSQQMLRELFTIRLVYSLERGRFDLTTVTTRFI